MLVLTVHIGDEIVVQTPAGDVRIRVGGPRNARRRLGIEAPKSCRIVRGEHAAPRPPAPLKPSVF